MMFIFYFALYVYVCFFYLSVFVLFALYILFLLWFILFFVSSGLFDKWYYFSFELCEVNNHPHN